MENTNKLLKEGKALLKALKIWPKIWIFSLAALLITVVCCGKYADRYLALSGAYDIVNFMMGVWYFLLGFSLSAFFFCYVFGMLFTGIGQLCLNTLPNTMPQEQPVNKPMSKPVSAPASGSGVGKTAPSIALVNSLAHALNAAFDEEMIGRLKDAKHRLTKPNEKQLIEQILSSPGGQVRQVAQRLYDTFTKEQAK